MRMAHRSTPHRATRTRVLTATTLAAAALVALPAGVAGGQDDGGACEQPYSPVAFAQTYPQQETLPEVDATDVARPVPRPGPFDSDGDGVDDVVTEQPGSGVTISRGDGDVVLAAPGATSIQAYGVGDIDGDGRDELAAYAFGTGDANTDTVLVDGTIAPGATPLADAGVRFGDPGMGIVLSRGDRLLVITSGGAGPGPGQTDFYTASEVLGQGPGHDLGGIRPSPAATGEAVALADLGGPTDTVVVVDTTPSDGARLTVADLPTDAGSDLTYLTTAPEPFVPNYVGPGAVGVLDGPDGSFIVLANADRSGSAAYLWSLDDPCTSLEAPAPPDEPAPEPPSAPPARPISTDASFTG